MSLSKQFSKKMDELWHKRSAAIRALVTSRGRGRQRALSKKIRQKLTGELLEIATKILLKREGQREFRNVVAKRSLRFIRGWGLESRLQCLLDWARTQCPGPIVYAFWQGKRCLYVGKGLSWRRLRNYAKSVYLRDATCVKVFCIRGKSHLAKAECLATHLFKPRDQKVKPSKAKWSKACPVCRQYNRIRREMTALFSLKSRLGERVKAVGKHKTKKHLRPPRRRGSRGPGVSLADLIAADLLKAPIRLFRKYKGQMLEATLLPTGEVEFHNQRYASPSAAAEAARTTVTGRKMHTNGWSFWQVQWDDGKPRTLGQVRDAYAKRG